MSLSHSKLKKTAISEWLLEPGSTGKGHGTLGPALTRFQHNRCDMAGDDCTRQVMIADLATQKHFPVHLLDPKNIRHLFETRNSYCWEPFQPSMPSVYKARSYQLGSNDMYNKVVNLPCFSMRCTSTGVRSTPPKRPIAVPSSIRLRANTPWPLTGEDLTATSGMLHPTGRLLMDQASKITPQDDTPGQTFTTLQSIASAFLVTRLP
jgi:hypothetical protein